VSNKLAKIMKVFRPQLRVPGQMQQVTAGAKDWPRPRYFTNFGIAAEWVSGLIFNDRVRQSIIK
jgi:hypothetical protein